MEKSYEWSPIKHLYGQMDRWLDSFVGNVTWQYGYLGAFCNVENHLTDDAEDYTFGGYHKKCIFYSRAITLPKIIQQENPAKYAQGLELLINPLKFYSNCISSMKGSPDKL